MYKLTLAAALAAIALPLSALAAPPRSEIAASGEERLPHISIVKLGKGSPVVMIPGLSSPRATWDGVAAKAASNHILYLIQVNGFAGDGPGANLEAGLLDGIVADISAYLARNKVGPARLVGHSMGGLVGLKFAAAHPEQVERLMLVDALPFFAVLLDPNATPASAEPVAKAMRDRVASAFGKPVEPATIEANVAGLALKDESRSRMRGWAKAADPRVTAQALYEDMTTQARPLLPAIRTPITLVYPWSTAAFGKERTDAFYRRQFTGAPDIRFVDIGDSGHFVMLDQPEAFAAALDAFLK